MKFERLPKNIKEYTLRGEGIDIEFKTSRTKLNRDAFDSICAFLNRNGGNLFLGVSDDGQIEGVDENSLQGIVDSITTGVNNPQRLSPTFYISPKIYMDENGNKIIHVFVPESSQVHNTKGRIFDRNEDGDLDITQNNSLVGQLYLRKQSSYSENKIYPYVNLEDFKSELFEHIRILAKNQRANHPWQSMTDEQLLQSAGLYKRDHQTGKYGYSLAAVLLFGKDEVIQSVLPYHKTDAILRVENTDRYDDRDDIRTNLIESYDRLMAFVRKHLPDKFYQEGEQRISLRDRIFREIVGNLLIHREYANAFPAKLIIEQGRVLAENWNRPHNAGVIDPANFSPYPKNPVIAKFFKEIGRVDELGSGVRNTFKYCGIYTPGTKPEFIEDDVFMAIIPLKEQESKVTIPVLQWEEVRRKVRGKFGEKFGESSEKIVELIYGNQFITALEMSKIIGITERAIEKQLARLKEKEIIERIGPAKGGFWKINL